MEASRVVVPIEKTQFEALSFKKKRQLREEAVMAYVRSRPFMSRIKLQEFMDVIQTNASSWAQLFISSMVKEGKLVKHNLSPRTFAYTVPGEVHVTKPAYPTLLTPEKAAELSRVQAEPTDNVQKPQEIASAPTNQTGLEPLTVRQLAERYFVATFGGNDFDEFIDWCDRKGY